MTASRSLLSTHGLCKRFGGVDAVSNISLDITEGEIRAIIGPNGSGKSTFINLLSGVYRPTAGSILFLGDAIAGLLPHAITRRGVARTFQNIRLFRELTVLENVMVGGDWRSSDNLWHSIAKTQTFRDAEVDARKQASIACTRLGIGALTDLPAGTLSYGQQRRVEIARALVAAPKLLLLDEPVAGMNASEAKELGEELKELQKQGLTILLIEHNVRFVMRVADRVSVFDYGQKIFEGVPEEVRKERRVIEAYLGSGDA